jgi:hypothetical protein
MTSPPKPAWSLASVHITEETVPHDARVTPRDSACDHALYACVPRGPVRAHDRPRISCRFRSENSNEHGGSMLGEPHESEAGTGAEIAVVRTYLWPGDRIG